MRRSPKWRSQLCCLSIDVWCARKYQLKTIVFRLIELNLRSSWPCFDKISEVINYKSENGWSKKIKISTPASQGGQNRQPVKSYVRLHRQSHRSIQEPPFSSSSHPLQAASGSTRGTSSIPILSWPSRIRCLLDRKTRTALGSPFLLKPIIITQIIYALNNSLSFKLTVFLWHKCYYFAHSLLKISVFLYWEVI